MPAGTAKVIVGGNNYIGANYYTMAADPTVNNDTADGINVHDHALNTVSGIMWECRSNAAGAAVWIAIPRLFQASAQPATGSWVIGDFVRNTAPVEAGSAASKYVITGWLRITTGSGNVATTDWLMCRSLTGN